MKRSDSHTMSRRDVLKMCLAPMPVIGAARWMVGCSDDGNAGAAERTSGGPDDPPPEPTDGGQADRVDVDAAVPWATGGTAAMRGDYPDPFAGGAGTACGLTTAMILGPCYASTLEREDISDGEPGLPVRLSFLVVRGDGCTPIAGATVDIWHAAPRGVYSSFPATTICNPGEEALESESFCRGVQTTDANGRVDFSTVFPGWYGGRAIHIHFTVRIDGNQYVTSQLFFEDSLNDEVLAQIDYASRGPRDTRNDADVFLPSDMAPFLLSTAKRSDGTLHVWKLLVVRSSLDEPLPTAPTDLPPLPPASPDGGVTP